MNEPVSINEARSSTKSRLRAYRFPLARFDTIKPDASASYLVKGLVPSAGLAVVWGEPKCGKSFWTFDLLMHVSLGWDYRGRRVKAGAIVYCALEGAQGVFFHGIGTPLRGDLHPIGTPWRRVHTGLLTLLEASIGMLVVETIAKIRRAYFSQGKPIKEICRELRVSRKVVRKVIRSDATEFRYERTRQPLPRIGPWRERLDGAAGGERGEGGARTADADPDIRGAAAGSAMTAATPRFVAMRCAGARSVRARRRRPTFR